MLTSLVTAGAVLAAGPCDSLPKALRRAIAQHYPGASVPVPERADSIWSGYVGTDLQTDGHPFCVTGDLDGNGTRDYALVLADSRGGRIVAFHRLGQRYVPHRMWVENGEERRTDAHPRAFALFRSPPSTHSDMHEEDAELRSPRVFVTAVHYESSSWEMVWTGSGYRTFWTSD